MPAYTLASLNLEIPRKFTHNNSLLTVRTHAETLTSRCMVPLASSKRGDTSCRLMALLGNTDTLLASTNSLRGVRICREGSGFEDTGF
jgi:hypothetical protein